MLGFLIGCTIGGFIMFCIGIYHIAIWGYSFIKNIRLFIRRVKLRHKEKHDLIFYCHDFVDVCRFEQMSDFEKSNLIRFTEKRELRLKGLSGFSRGDYHDTH